MSFAHAFLAGDPAATALLSDGFRRRADRAAAVGAARRPVSAALIRALEGQLNAWGARPAQRSALRALEGGAVAVVTGQQVGLHLGPLYTIHKAAAAVVTARTLQEETGHPCVPVFWLQTEDHDLAEIRGVGLPGATLSVADDGRDGVSVWHRVLGPDVEALPLAEHLGHAPHATEVVAWFGRHYRAGTGWHTAFAGALCELLGDAGLLLLDPRDPAVATLSAPVLRASLTADLGALAERGEALRAAGFSEQVHVRPGSPLAFFHPHGAEGPRARLDPHGDGWRVAGTGQTVSTAAILRAADQDPRVLSTSALLRPLVQDTLLPTAMTLGGPGEIAYMAQLPPLYEHLGLPMPLVGPRASLRLVDARSRSRLDALGLSTADLARPREALLATLAERRGAPRVQDLHAALRTDVDALLTRFASQATAPPDALDKTRRSVHHALLRLAERTASALATRDAVTAGRLDRLLAVMHPGGAPQERTLGVAWAAARVGLGALASKILAACVPFDGATRDVELER